MTARHWTEDDFLNRVYGLEGGDEAHLAGCDRCRAQWHSFEQRRAQLTAEPDLSHEFLAAERRAIYRRLDKPAGHPFRWASALAATLMLAMGLLFFRLGQTSQPVQPTSDDDAVFAEVYSIEQASEPQAVKPIQGLFEEN